MEQFADKTTSPDCFVAFVVQHCIGFFSNPLNSGLKDPASLLFARYIAMQVCGPRLTNIVIPCPSFTY